ncbi:MAG: hypothetical protein QM619_10150 [Micropruina sp.]|uniref:hypothetical protein n=1 Tax=Micropruina sp. TaxID=2737536 RepID=UPI0039E226F4
MSRHNQDSPGVLRVLAEHDVRFVLIGGLAAVLQGSPYPTEDVDITPEQTIRNLERLSAALTALGARVYTQSEPDGLPFSHDAESLAGSSVWNLVTNLGRLDISFVPDGTTGFADLTRSALTIAIRGTDVRVADLADVIRSKQAANRPKDQRVLMTLREILAHRKAD